MSGLQFVTSDRRIFLMGLGAACLAPEGFAQPSDRDIAFPVRVAIGAEMRALKSEVYDPAYVKLAYPMGDVPDDRGVCTDTVIRAFRHAGVDLQVNAGYPDAWGTARHWAEEEESPFERMRILDPAPNPAFIERIRDQFTDPSLGGIAAVGAAFFWREFWSVPRIFSAALLRADLSDKISGPIMCTADNLSR